MRCWYRRSRGLKLLALLPIIVIIIVPHSLLRYIFIRSWLGKRGSVWWWSIQSCALMRTIIIIIIFLRVKLMLVLMTFDIGIIKANTLSSRASAYFVNY